MEAKKLKSGSWNCTVFSHFEDVPDGKGGTKKKRIYKSFTVDDPSKKGKKKCEAMASKWMLEKENLVKSSRINFKRASESYIESKSNVLSVTTIRTYKQYCKTYFDSINSFMIDDITSRDLQIFINEISEGKSPKTVRNIYGFVRSVILMFRPDMIFSVTLPQKEKIDIVVPSDAQIKQILEYADSIGNEDLKIAIMLASFGPMRRGEICALTSDEIDGNTIHVRKNMVKRGYNEDNIWVIKQPKSTAGTRDIPMPDFVMDLIRNKKGRIISYTPDALSDAFVKALRHAGMKHFRFHDMRHYSASIQSAIGICDSDIMSRSGWSSSRTLNAVYKHSIEESRKKSDRKINDYFDKTFNDANDAKRNAKRT